MIKTIVNSYNETKQFNYTLADCNAEKAIKLYNSLKECGFNVEISAEWGQHSDGKCHFQIEVNDYSHSDCDGNNYCYCFDPNTGKEI